MKIKEYTKNNKKYRILVKGSPKQKLTDGERLTSFLHKINETKYYNDKQSILSYQILKDNNDSLYFVFFLKNNEKYIIKANKIKTPNIELQNVNSKEIGEDNINKIKKVLKNTYKDLFSDFKILDFENENDKKSLTLSITFKSNYFEKETITDKIRINKLDGEDINIVNPNDFPNLNENETKETNENKNFTDNIKILDEGDLENKNENGFYNLGTISANINLKAKYYRKKINIHKTIDTSLYNKLKEYTEEKLKDKINEYERLNSEQLLSFDKEKELFYFEIDLVKKEPFDYYFKTKEKYKLYVIGNSNDFYFKDIGFEKIDLKKEEDLNKLLLFLKYEYEDIKDIDVKNNTIIKENTIYPYIIVTVTTHNNEKYDAKVFLENDKNRYINDPSFRSMILEKTNIYVPYDEILSKKMSQKTMKYINELLDDKINNNVFYDEQKLMLNNSKIYEENNGINTFYSIRLYNYSMDDYFSVYIKPKENMKIDNWNLVKINETTNIEELKLKKYNCKKEGGNDFFISENGDYTILDYLNKNINDELYIDSLKLDLSYIYVKLNKKETKEFDSNYLIKIDNKENIKVAFLENINKDLFLTEQNKKDIIKLLQEYSDNTFYKIEIIDEKLQKENKDNLFSINIRIYIDENNKFESKFFIFTDTPYQLEMDVNSLTKKIKNSVCPDSEVMYLDFPEYGRSCNNAFRYKIVIPNIIDLKYKKNKECIPNETVPQLPIPPKPQISTKKVTIITPNQNNENKKEEIVENKEKSNIENIKNEVEINNFKNEITRNIKTGDGLFNIIYLIGTFGILAYFISLLKNKYKHKLN